MLDVKYLPGSIGRPDGAADGKKLSVNSAREARRAVLAGRQAFASHLRATGLCRVLELEKRARGNIVGRRVTNEPDDSARR